MTDLAPAPLRAKLPRFDPDRARAQNRALELLSTLVVEHERAPLRVQAAVREPSAQGAFVFAAPPGWLSVSPEIVDGVPAAALDPDRDLTAALSALGRLEPVFAALERVSGSSLEPLGLEADTRPGTLALGLELRTSDGALIHALTINLSVELARTWPAPSGPPPDLGAADAAPVACRVLADGPAMDRAALATLERGALLLLPRPGVQGWPARLEAGSDRTARGWVDWARAHFTPSSFEDRPMFVDPPEDASVQEPPGSEPAGAEGGFPVETLPVTIRVAVDGVQTSVGELARLQPGSILMLPDLGDSPRVTVLAENRPVAEGRLMAVGEAYGVLIERVNA